MSKFVVVWCTLLALLMEIQADSPPVDNIEILHNAWAIKQRYRREVLPGPSHLTGSAISNSQVFLTWDLPQRSHGLGLKSSTSSHYIVKVKRNDTLSLEKTIRVEGFLQASKQVNGLNSSTAYVFTISLKTSSGNSPETVSAPVRTWDERPDKVQNLAVTNRTSDSILLQWKPPPRINGRGNLAAFVVYVRPSRTETCTVIKAFVYRREDFRWNQMESLCRLPAHQDVKTNFPNQTDLVEMEITSLDPYMEYNISVTTYNSFGTGQPFEITKRTRIGVPLKPRDIKGTIESNSEIFLTWSVPFVYPGPSNYSIGVNTNGSASPDVKTINVVGYNTNSTWIRHLNSSTIYEFSVMAQTSAGQSAKSVSEPLRTWDERPDKVQNLIVDSKTSLSIMLQWRTPLHINGRGQLTAFMVYIRLHATNHNDSHPCISTKAIVYKQECFHTSKTDHFCKLPGKEDIEKINQPLEYSAAAQNMNLTDLLPYVKYDIVVIAYNTFGPGEPFQITERTNIAIPSEPSRLEGEVRSNSEVNLTWSPPPLNPGPTTYVIKVKQNGSVLTDYVRIINVEGYTNTSYLVSGLKSSTLYAFTAMAKTSAGISSETESDSIRTWDERSDKVQGLKVTGKTNDSVTLQWTSPLHINGRGILTAFVVYVRRNHTSDNMPNIQRCTSAIAIVQSNITEFNLDKSLNSSFCQVPQGSLIRHNSPLLPTFPISTTLQNLDPYVRYDVIVTAYNTFGHGTPARITITTDMGLRCLYLRPGLLTIVWEPPTNTTEQVTFDVDVMESDLPIDTTKGSHSFYDVNSTTNASVEISNARPYWSYMVSVTPTTRAGGPMSEQVVHCFMPNLGEAAGPVKFFNVTRVPGDVHKAMVTFRCPKLKDRHGAIEGFIIRADSENSRLEEFIEPRQLGSTKNDPETPCGGLYQRDMSIAPDVLYTFQIRVRLVNVSSLGEPVFQNFSTSIRPPPPLKNVLSVVGVAGKNRDGSVTVVQICKPCVLNRSNGDILSAGLVICPDAHCGQASLNINRARTWKDARHTNFNVSFVSTDKDWLTKVKDSHSNTLAYTIGADKTCGLSASDYCNGPLPPNRKFWIRVFTCTQAGCTVSDGLAFFTPESTTDNASRVPIIAGSAAGGVTAVVIVVVVIFVVTRKRRGNQRPSFRKCEIGHPNPGSPLPDLELTHRPSISKSGTVKKKSQVVEQKKRPVAIGEFESHLIRLRNRDVLWNREFLDLEKVSPEHDAKEGSRPENKQANRLAHNVPFDHSRVRLYDTDDDSSDDTRPRDYINANFVPGLNEPKNYIATQGPLRKTIGDFWRMVWEQEASVVVMLSEFQDKGKESSLRVARYLPHDGESCSHQYGDIIVSRTRKLDSAHWEVRNIKLKHEVTKKCRFVKHFLFKSWVDPETNMKPNILISFLQTVQREAILTPQAPLVVHCSDGIGRTGTYLAIDYLKDYLDDLAQSAADEKEFLQEKVDIFESVLNMRNYRKMLVQTRAQYSFIYEAVSSLIKDKTDDFGGRDNDYYYEDDENVYQCFPDEDDLPPAYKSRECYTNDTSQMIYTNENAGGADAHEDLDNEMIYEEVVFKADVCHTSM